MNINLVKFIETAILVSISFLLNFFEGLWFRLPTGGSIGISMLPLMIIGFRNGILFGLLGGFLMSLVKMLLAPQISLVPENLFIVIIQVLLDYILIYPSVAFMCGLYSYLVRKDKIKLNLSYTLFFAFLAGFLRFILHLISGYVFWGQYRVELFGILFDTFSYSFIYNSLYMFPSILLCILFILVIYLRNKKLLFR